MNSGFSRWLVFIGLILIPTLLWWHAIDQIALEYDEMMWVNTVFRHNTLFQKFPWNGEYLYFMHYIGALKGFFYRFLFLFVEPSVYAVRIPMLLLTGTSIALLYRFVFSPFKTAGLLFAVYLCLDPTISLYALIDKGPSNIEFFFRSALLLFVILWAQGLIKYRYFLLLILIGILGLWNKISFIWYLIPLFLIFPTAHYLKQANIRNTQVKIKFDAIEKESKRYYSILGIGVLLMVLGILMLQMLKSNQANLFELTNNDLPRKINHLWSLLSGTSSFHWWSKGVEFQIWYGVLNLLLLIGGIILSIWCFFRKNKSSISRLDTTAFACTCACITGFLIILIIPLANKSWHMYTLYPFIPILQFYLIQKISKQSWIRTGLVSILILGSLWNIMMVNTAIYKKSSITLHDWANAEVYDRFFTSLRKTNDPVYFFDWGFHTQAIFYDQSRQYQNISRQFGKGDDNKYIQQINLLPNNALLVSHGPLTITSWGNSMNDRFYGLISKTKFCEEERFVDEQEKALIITFSRSSCTP